MADTGAPWNLPYPLPTDLVRDGADAIKDLAEQVAVGLDAAGNAGIGSNVVQTVKTNVFTTTSTAYVDITGMTVTITPSSATSKILVIAYAVGASTQATGASSAHLRLIRGSTVLTVGQTEGSRTANAGNVGTRGSGAVDFLNSATIVELDSPGTTAATTYALQLSTGGAGTAFINRTENDFNSAGTGRPICSITVVEVAA